MFNTYFWNKNRKIFMISVLTLAVSLNFSISAKYVQAEETASVEEVEEQPVDMTVPTQEPVVSVAPTATPKPTPKATNKPTKNTLVVKKKKCTYPKSLYQGQAFTIKGTIKANHKMKKVTASIVNEEGDSKYKVQKNAKKSKSFNLSKVDAEMKFSALDAGEYAYKVNVTDISGNTQVALEKEFTVKETDWRWPVDGGRCGDGWHCSCSTHGGRHFGVDICSISKGTPIHAVKDGEVVYAQYHAAATAMSFGKLVIIHHGNGIYSYYAHCNSIKVKAGDKVEKGDVISTAGSTGAAYGVHLHLELRKGPEFSGDYGSNDFLDKTTYKQFNPMKKGYLKY